MRYDRRMLGWFQRLRLERAARKLPLTPMRDVVAGPRVKVAGVAALREAPLLSPIGRWPCAAWSLTIKGGGRRRDWSHDLHQWDAAEFVIVDEAGWAARIASVGRADIVYELPRWQAPTRRVFDLVREHRGDAEDLAIGSYRWREGVIADGDRIVVVGVARREIDPTARAAPTTYREPPTRLVFEATDAAPLWIFGEWGAR